jgi:hypothetical protein
LAIGKEMPDGSAGSPTLVGHDSLRRNFGNMQKGIPDIAAGNSFVVLRRSV